MSKGYWRLLSKEQYMHKRNVELHKEDRIQMPAIEKCSLCGNNMKRVAGDPFSFVCECNPELVLSIL